MKKLYPYSICVIDIGSPKLGNIGWSLMNNNGTDEWSGQELDELFPLISDQLEAGGLLLGLEAPLFVPIRDDLLLATKARKGEERRPWSAGAGAQVLAMNLPLMVYIFKKIINIAKAEFIINSEHFSGATGQTLIFEAFVSGKDKGDSHIEDARIMSHYCAQYSKINRLPNTILEDEPGVSYFNLAAAALLQCGGIKNLNDLHIQSPIFRPKSD